MPSKKDCLPVVRRCDPLSSPLCGIGIQCIAMTHSAREASSCTSSAERSTNNAFLGHRITNCLVQNHAAIKHSIANCNCVLCQQSVHAADIVHSFWTHFRKCSTPHRLPPSFLASHGHCASIPARRLHACHTPRVCFSARMCDIRAHSADRCMSTPMITCKAVSPPRF